MKKIIFPMLLVLMLTLLMHSASAAQFLPTGFVLGDCYDSATVNITVYTEGFLNDQAQIIDTTITTASATGSYGTITGNLADSTNFDVNITVTNPTCSASAKGSAALLSQTTGGPIDPPVQLDANITTTTVFAMTAPSNGSSTGDNETTFTWLNDYSGTTYILQIANTSAFSVLERNISGIGTLTYQLNNSQELTDGTYYVRVQALQNSSIIDTTDPFNFQVSAGEAIISGVTPTNASWFGSAGQTLSLTTDKNAECRYATSSGVGYASKTVFSTTSTTSHSTTVTLSTEGVNNFFIQCNATTSGVVNANDYVHAFRYDTTAPNASAAVVTIDNGSANSTDTTLDLNWTGFTDSGSGVVGYYYSFTNNEGTTTGTVTNATTGTLSSASQSTVTIYVWAADAAGNIGLAASDDIFVDSLPPQYSSWSSSPADLNKLTIGTYRVDFLVTEASSFSTAPIFRFRIGSDSWSNWSNATLSSSGGSLHNYYLTIAERSSPNTWFERSGENLTYEVYTVDVYNHSNNISRYEFINNETNPPTLSNISNQLATEDVQLAFNLTAIDLDLNTLTYTCNISGASVSKVNNTLATVTWTPTNSDVGTHMYHCNVTDSTYIVSDTFTITVINSNDVPVLAEIGDLYAQEYEFFNFTLNATDADDDTLVFNSNSTIFSLNPITGIIGFTPFSSQRGIYKFNFTVSDGQGGVDSELITFTVGYCGDNVCKSGYETCSVCELDCGTCDSGKSKALIVQPRNCLDETMTVEAVALVQRATCDIRGKIIDEKEACGAEKDTTLVAYYSVDSAWEEVAEVITNTDGIATFTPTEKGVYELAFKEDRDNSIAFEVDECIQEEKQTPPQTSTESKAQTPSLPPAIEKPQEQKPIEESLGFFAGLLYFFILPLLIVGVLISSMGYVYKLEKKKPNSQYVLFIDKMLKEMNKYKTQALEWMNKTTPFKEAIVYLNKAKIEVKNMWLLVKKDLVDYTAKALIMAGLQKKIKIPTYNLKEKGKELHLLLISLIKFKYKEENVAKLTSSVYQYTVKTILDVAALLMSRNIKIRMIESQTTDPMYLKALLLKGLTYKGKKGTRVDIESSLQRSNPVVCLINELGENNTLIQALVIVYSFDKNAFYFHDYQRRAFKQKLSKEEFIKAWRSAGSKAIFLES